MLTLCLQAGGKSSRMGTDKALLDFGGHPLIQQVLTRLESFATETIITTNDPEKYRFLGLPTFTDLIPDRGALGGLFTALSAASQPLVAVVACDLPFVNLKILERCRDQLVENPFLDAVIPSTARGLEPLHAVYRKETCLPAVKMAIDNGKWKMIAWHNQVKVKILSADLVEQLDPNGLAFQNVNTPDEFRSALKRLKMGSE
jgi:molybdopterin-guanine dinucleotide biosynthesis protein A